MKIAVVALGKIGLPLAVQFATKGHEVVGVDVNRAGRRPGQRGRGALPRRGRPRRAARASRSPAGRLRATTDYADAIPGADAVVVVVPLFVDDATGEPDFGWMDAATASLAEHLTPGTLVTYETTLPVGTTRTRWKPMLEEVSGLTEGQRLPPRLLARAGAHRPGLRRPAQVPEARRRPHRRGRRRRRVAFYEAVLDFDERPDLDRGPTASGTSARAEAAELAKLAETTYRDVNIGLANQFARFADAERHRRARRSSRPRNSQPYSHIHRPGIAVGGHCIPVYPRLYLWNDPEATVVRAAREANAGMPELRRRRCSRARYGDLAGARVVVLGAAYRGGVKETAFSGVFPTVEALQAPRRRGAACTTRCTPTRSSARSASTPYHLGEPVDAAVVQADHAEYRDLSPPSLPGLKVLVDGRQVTDPARFQGVTHRVIGLAQR